RAGRLPGAAARGGLGAGARGTLGGSALVHFLGQLVAGLREVVHRLLDRVGVVALEGVLQAVQRAFDGPAHVATNLLAIVAQGLLRLVNQRVGVILQVDQLAALLVLGGVGLGVTLHLLDLLLAQAARVLHGDL